MKIAFCFSGQLRNVYSTYEQWFRPNVIDVNKEHDIDFFGHSWFDKNSVGSVYKAANRVRDAVDANAPVPHNIIQQIYDCYNPVAIKLQRQVEFDEKDYNDRKLPDAVPLNGLSRACSIFKVAELKRQHETDNNFVYDVVVFTRYDFQLKEPFNFSMVKEQAVYHPGYSPHGFNVCYAMGPSQIMDYYSALYPNIDKVYRSGVVWCDELLASGFLKLINVPTIDFHILNGINRTGG